MTELNKYDICPIEEGRTQYIPFRKLEYLTLKKPEDEEEEEEHEEEEEAGKFIPYNDNIKCNTREEDRFFGRLEKLISNKEDPDWTKKQETCVSRTVAVCPLRNIFVAVNELCDLFCFDLDNNKYWWVMNCPDFISIYFHPYSESLIFIGRKNGRIDELSIETKTIYGFFKEHTYGVRSMSFSNYMCLSHSNYEAWIWDINTFEPLFSLALKNNLPRAIVTFVPNQKNYIITLFPCNTFYVWSEREGYFPVLKEIYSGSEFNLSRTTKILEFSPWDEPLVALGGNHNQIHIINIANPVKWFLEKIFLLPEKQKYTKGIKFLSICDFRSNNKQEEKKCLAVFASPIREITIYDLDKNDGEAIVDIIDIEEDPAEFEITYDGKFALFQTYKGVLDIYTTFWWLSRNFYPWLHFNRLAHIFVFHKKNSKHLTSNIASKESIYMYFGNNKFSEEHSVILSEQEITDIKNIISPRDRFKRVLLGYGKVQNTNRHEQWIWAFELPFNVKAFDKLYSKKGLHPYCTDFSLKFQYLPPKYLVKYIRLMSIFYWRSSIFIVIKDFENIVLHFCNFFSWCTLSAFEFIITIIENYCSHWFGCWSEAPEEVNIVINKILDNDTELTAHFQGYNMKASDVGWILLRSFFINALSMSDWMILWDHIIAGDDKFMIMVAASFIFNCRSCFLDLKTRKELENFQKYLGNCISKRNTLPSILNLAYDLHYNQMKNDWPFKEFKFTPIPKALSYPNLKIEYDEYVLQEAILHIQQKKEIEFIQLQERLDSLALLDPRIYHPVKKETNIKTFFIDDEKTKAHAEYNDLNNNLVVIYNELIENKMKEEERLKKHKQIKIKKIVVLECLLHILKKHELVWFKCFSWRCEERKRLISFEETIKMQRNKNLKNNEIYIEEIPMKEKIEIKPPATTDFPKLEDFHIKSLEGRSLFSADRMNFLKFGNIDHNKKIFRDLGYSIENDLKRKIKEFHLIEHLNKYQTGEGQEAFIKDLSGRLLITFDFRSYTELQNLPVLEKIFNDIGLRIEDQLQIALMGLRKLKCQMTIDLNETFSSSSESDAWPTFKAKSAKEIEELFFSTQNIQRKEPVLETTYLNTVESSEVKMYTKLGKKKKKISEISIKSRETEIKNEAEELISSGEQTPQNKLDEQPTVRKETLSIRSSFNKLGEEEEYSDDSHDPSEKCLDLEHYSKLGSKERSTYPSDVISTANEKLNLRRKKQLNFIKSLDIEFNKGQIKMLLEFLENEIPDLRKRNSEL